MANISSPITLGVEEEYWIVEPSSYSLSNRVEDIMAGIRSDMSARVKREFLQCQIEVSTPICHTAHAVRDELRTLRTALSQVASEKDLRIAASATHPFSKWEDQLITSGHRYQVFVDRMQEAVRRLLTCGMHVHLGIGDDDATLNVYNGIRSFLPVFLGLSVNSPFYSGRKTGLMSYRGVVFRSLPRTGIPPYFPTYEDYLSFMNTLINVDEIEDPSTIWWDVRIHHKYKTVEVRICDACTSIEIAISIVALIHLVAYLLRDSVEYKPKTPAEREMIEINKWRALRYGTNGMMYDLFTGRQVSCGEMIRDIIKKSSKYVNSLGYHEEMLKIEEILSDGTDADWQLKQYELTGCLHSVMQSIVERTLHSK